LQKRKRGSKYFRKGKEAIKESIDHASQELDKKFKTSQELIDYAFNRALILVAVVAVAVFINKRLK